VEVGIGNEKIYIGVRHFPDRKKPSFVVERGNQAVVLGSFINEHAVEEFEKGLKELLGGGE
jgi:hypothetical protein